MQPHHVHERTPLPATSSPEAALVAGWLTASAVGAAWLALASATGLIYHFAPGAPFAAAAFAYRWRSGGGRVPGGRVAALLLGAAAATAAALLALHAAARSTRRPGGDRGGRRCGRRGVRDLAPPRRHARCRALTGVL